MSDWVQYIQIGATSIAMTPRAVAATRQELAEDEIAGLHQKVSSLSALRLQHLAPARPTHFKRGRT